MSDKHWPDPLRPTDPSHVEFFLHEFWRQLQTLPDLLNRREYLLAEQLTHRLRQIVLELMLALNGIQWPVETKHPNRYLGESQRAAIQKTLLLPNISAESLIGQAVALVVIYRWYAPQLVEKFNLAYPQTLEAEVWQQLQQRLPDWPLTVTTG
jgi:hypothetical protein